MWSNLKPARLRRPNRLDNLCYLFRDCYLKFRDGYLKFRDETKFKFKFFSSLNLNLKLELTCDETQVLDETRLNRLAADHRISRQQPPHARLLARL